MLTKMIFCVKLLVTRKGVKMKVEKAMPITEKFLKEFMKKNKLSRGEVWEQHELKALMEGYLLFVYNALGEKD